MKSPASMGMNRTGIDTSPEQFQELLTGLEEFPPTTTEDEETLEVSRAAYIRDADPIGTVPPLGTVKGVVKEGMQKLMGRNAGVFIDALGGRLAFERTGTRLYDAFLEKCEVRSEEAAILPIDRLRQFRQEEAAHLEMVWDALRQLGADPTCVTPLADANGVASIGVMQLLADPRTSIAQSLHAIHIAELVDNDGWQQLIKLALTLGQNTMAEQFRRAMAEEDQHLTVIRQLVEQLTAAQAGAA